MFRGFHEQFPDIGVTENRMVMTFANGRVTERFLFLELYCDEAGCDCRRVIVKAVRVGEDPSDPARELAALSFGWEPEQFYRNWARYPLEAYELEELKGPALQLLAPQSVRADEMLAHFRILLQDEAYVDRIRHHYRMFRKVVDGTTTTKPSGNRAERRSRRRGPVRYAAR